MTTISETIAAKKLKIEERIVSESDLTYDLIDRLGKLSLALGAGSSVGGGGTDAVTIASGVSAATAIVSIKNSLTTIAAELTKPNIQPIVNGYIAVGGESQMLLPARPGRRYLEVLAAEQALWINIDAPAGFQQGILILPSNQSWFSPSQLLVEGQVNVWCYTAGTSYCAIEG